jgi:trehalose/maltose hydrolase-like predicted phosphorylase
VTSAVARSRLASRARDRALPPELRRRFEAVIFDWDGTAVPDRQADASSLRGVVESLCAAGMHLAVVTGTHLGNVDGQLRARPAGCGRLYLCLNRGSEVFAVGSDGPEPIAGRTATPAEDDALDRAARGTVARLAARGLRAEIVSQRLNRRKIDLIPEPAWSDPPKARIGELVAAVESRLRAAGLDGLGDVIAIAEASARDAGLTDPKVTSDAKHVEIGLTDKSDSARWMFAELWRLGVAPSQVIVAGDEFGPLAGMPGSDSYLLPDEAQGAAAVSVGREPTGVPKGVIAFPGGPDAFALVLADQLRRRRRGDLPVLADDPSWAMTLHGFDSELERVHSSLLTVADGVIGTAGSPVGSHRAARPRVLAAGLYMGNGPETDLAPCPVWTRLDGALLQPASFERTLDLRTGLLRERLRGSADVEALLFSSFARPGTVVLRACGTQELLASKQPVLPAEETSVDAGVDDGAIWLRQRSGTGGVVAAGRDALRQNTLDRVATYVVDPGVMPDPEDAMRRLAAANELGFDELLDEHRARWAERWETADIRIDGDDELQRLVRFALFHLMSSVGDRHEAAVGARGLTGPAYRGHVFWDADVFVLPFLAATHPPAARAMLEYRLRRLQAARANAVRLGRAGARFPWESARSGVDVTPSHARDQTGRIVPIRTGELEEHIVADVAWAAAFYEDWTGDAAFSGGPGLDLLIATARYWASRVRVDAHGRAHIYGVIGPDEYHEPVDDNAFTNVLARWNLRRAARAAEGRVAEAERRRWLQLAASLVDGYDPETQLYEQFAGFYGLEPLVVADIARRPIAADLLLGPERVAGAQVLKQADVVLLHHLVPEEVASGSLEPNLAFYEPRTAHGSSLSPAIHAALLARAGRFGPALDALRLSCRLDVDDLTGTTSGGLHLATMGGVWQALVFGFGGVRVFEDRLTVDPRLPEAWNVLELRLKFRGHPVRIRIEQDSLTVDTHSAVPVFVDGRPGRRFERRQSTWKEASE